MHTVSEFQVSLDLQRICCCIPIGYWKTQQRCGHATTSTRTKIILENVVSILREGNNKNKNNMTAKMRIYKQDIHAFMCLIVCMYI
mmetsp:Transcript_23625/g.36341  ORF Transcript_23625/g.36341 Transcript_23625/m.36341 type:complete len:86 (-) Transcript_23625:84-341(-)